MYRVEQPWISGVSENTLALMEVVVVVGVVVYTVKVNSEKYCWRDTGSAEIRLCMRTDTTVVGVRGGTEKEVGMRQVTTQWGKRKKEIVRRGRDSWVRVDVCVKQNHREVQKHKVKWKSAGDACAYRCWCLVSYARGKKKVGERLSTYRGLSESTLEIQSRPS